MHHNASEVNCISYKGSECRADGSADFNGVQCCEVKSTAMKRWIERESSASSNQDNFNQHCTALKII